MNLFYLSITSKKKASSLCIIPKCVFILIVQKKDGISTIKIYKPDLASSSDTMYDIVLLDTSFIQEMQFPFRES
jgi:hypothetical protein